MLLACSLEALISAGLAACETSKGRSYTVDMKPASKARAPPAR